MSSLADRLTAARPEPKKPTLDQWLAQLSPEDLKVFKAEVSDETRWNNQAVQNFLMDEGVAVGKDRVKSFLAGVRRESD